MPVNADGTVHFSTTLLALVRESLYIRMGPGKYAIKYVNTFTFLFAINENIWFSQTLTAITV